MNRTGTSHFVDKAAARAYYSAQGFTRADVNRKIAEGEIFLGKPDTVDGQAFGVIAGEGRYWVGDKPALNACPTCPHGRGFHCAQCWPKVRA
jgi:hypothetical protein